MTQLHDLEAVGGVEDFDWIAMPTIARHSYEVRISGNLSWDAGICATCAQVERVNAAGAILTEDVSTVNEGNGGPLESRDRSIRWIAPSTNSLDSFIRVRGSLIFSETADSIYQIRGYDTTYGVPRWNNANGQITVFLITNMVDASVSGDIHFYNHRRNAPGQSPVHDPQARAVRREHRDDRCAGRALWPRPGGAHGRLWRAGGQGGRPRAGHRLQF